MSRSISSHNLPRLYLIKVSKWLMLFMPVIVLFYTENGLNMRQILTLQAIYSAAVVVLEIPSGYFADVLGRKKTIVLGSFLGVAGFGMYCIAGGFWGFLAAEAILGLGQSLVSGADSAVLYDSLLEDGREKRYSRYEGRLVSFGNFAEAGASIIGGALAGLSLWHPFYFQVGIAFLAVPAALGLREPVLVHRISKPRPGQILTIVRLCLFHHVYLRHTIVLSSIIGASTLTFAWFVQPFLMQTSLRLELYGIVWAGLNALVGVFAIWAHRVENFTTKGSLSTFLVISLALGYFLTASLPHWAAFGAVVAFYCVRGIATPVLKNYINLATSSEIRATVLSVRNFVIRIIFVLVAPALGWLTDSFSLGMALIVAGAAFLAMSLTTLFFFIRHIKITPDPVLLSLRTE